MAANSFPVLAAAGEMAENPGVRDVMRWFTREKQWVNDIHLQLCRIPAPTFLEQERALWFASQLRAIGWHASIDRAGNVTATLSAAPEDNLIALTAHLDTVLAPRVKDDVSVDPDGDMLGPGVSDNGTGLAALLAIAKAVKSSPRPHEIWRRLILIANVGEEGEGNLAGMRFICSQADLIARISAFLVLDGAATDHITTHALGSRRFEVTFTGNGGHSWSDFGTGNPVHALTRAVTSFIDQNPLDPRATPKVTLNVGLIEGGTGINAIPSAAKAKIDIRSEDNERIGLLVNALKRAVSESAEFENQRSPGPGVQYRIREIGSRPAARLAPDSNLLAVIRSVDLHLGIRSRTECASTDANIPLSLGIPAISIGAGGKGGGAHTPTEWYSPVGRDLGLKRILLTAALLLQEPGGSR